MSCVYYTRSSWCRIWCVLLNSQNILWVSFQVSGQLYFFQVYFVQKIFATYQSMLLVIHKQNKIYAVKKVFTVKKFHFCNVMNLYWWLYYCSNMKFCAKITPFISRDYFIKLVSTMFFIKSKLYWYVWINFCSLLEKKKETFLTLAMKWIIY